VGATTRRPGLPAGTGRRTMAAIRRCGGRMKRKVPGRGEPPPEADLPVVAAGYRATLKRQPQITSISLSVKSG
jgi:hypothetical protein